MPSTKIDCVALGGALGAALDKVAFVDQFLYDSNDFRRQFQIFVCAGNTVKGYSKKGKQFFTFSTNTTETVSTLYAFVLLVFRQIISLRRRVQYDGRLMDS